jgi:hypothetical protein
MLPEYLKMAFISKNVENALRKAALAATVVNFFEMFYCCVEKGSIKNVLITILSSHN